MRLIDLSIAAGRKRQSPRTGLVHYFPGMEGHADTIPLYENFCMAFALFRLKTQEGVTEGKQLIERLLAFQAEDGNFPVYLHDYPKCWDYQLAAKIAPTLKNLLYDFGTVLNSSYKEKLVAAINKIHQKLKEETLFDQIISERGSCYPISYNRRLQTYLGKSEPQEKGEPQPLPIEYVLAEKDGFQSRLQKDHIHQLYAALLPSFSSSLEVDEMYTLQPEFSRLLWAGQTVHSLVFPNGIHLGDAFVFTLPAVVDIGRDDLFEVLAFCDISPETSLYINGEKSMVFHLGDTVEIRTPALKVALRFELISGSGDFCGHISYANRPGQIACHGSHQFDAYDYQIGVRTLRRQGPCTIHCKIEIKTLFE